MNKSRRRLERYIALDFWRFLSYILLPISYICSLTTCVPIAQQTGQTTTDSKNPSYFADKKLRMDDYAYEPSIRTDQVYPKPTESADPRQAMLQPAVIAVNSPAPLLLEFDELNGNPTTYHARIYHCNADWSVSLLSDIEFLDEFNDFILTQYNLSFNTKIPYVHYSFDVPRVKLPGNYVVMVHREGNVKDIVLTRRFIVVDNRIGITAEITSSTGVSERNTNQQVNFAIDYPGYPLTNPRQTVKVVIRQNYRWNNAIKNLLPTSVQEDVQRLEYDYFNLENNFAAGNEYRFFDVRSVRFQGMNVGKINATSDSAQVYLLPDKSRAQQPYTQTEDFNGQYYIDNYETHRGSSEADYVNVHFTLRTPQRAPGNVYVWGAFANWRLTPENELTYNASAQAYQGDVLLKQGYYNYAYVLATDSAQADETYFEGSFFNTENDYEIIVYYRPPASRSDLIIGYRLLRQNRR